MSSSEMTMMMMRQSLKMSVRRTRKMTKTKTKTRMNVTRTMRTRTRTRMNVTRTTRTRMNMTMRMRTRTTRTRTRTRMNVTRTMTKRTMRMKSVMKTSCGCSMRKSCWMNGLKMMTTMPLNLHHRHCCSPRHCLRRCSFGRLLHTMSRSTARHTRCMLDALGEQGDCFRAMPLPRSSPSGLGHPHSLSVPGAPLYAALTFPHRHPLRCQHPTATAKKEMRESEKCGQSTSSRHHVLSSPPARNAPIHWKTAARTRSICKSEPLHVRLPR
jgi:hypothetical protein